MRVPGGRTLVAACCVVAFLAVSYSNHFQNSFHFDDSHTIVDNLYIRDLQNLGLFFSDTRTFGALPINRVYRPLVTASLAIDYALAKGLNPFYFHLSTFLWFAVQILLMWALFRKIFDLTRPDPRNSWVALFAAVLYGVHPATAETVNYIIQRGDVYSTLGVIAALVLYASFPDRRKSGWYLAPLALALLSKPPALVFPVILFVYVRLFEEKRLASAMVRCVPAFVTAAVFGCLAWAMTPATFEPTAGSSYAYRITQPLVALRYFSTFFMPNRLTADTDFAAAESIFQGGAWAGFVFVIALIALAAWCSSRRDWRPTAFGLWWFLLGLAPPAIFPLAEVENDHRMYFPFVGLMLAVSWPIALWIQRRQPLRRSTLAAIAAGSAVILATSVWATRQRNEVWRTEESLWLDVTIKSPRNGRGLMNYGLTQMEKGDYRKALEYFERAAAFTPAYATLEINLGIANGGLNQDNDAEKHFERALALKPDSAEGYYFLGRWLRQKNRLPEAVSRLDRAVDLNPDHAPSRYLLLEIYGERAEWGKLRSAAESALQRFPADATIAAFLARANAPVDPASSTHPQTAEDYLNLSLAYHRAGKYQECIQAAREALKLRPNYAEAYNNIAAAYEELHLWDQAIDAARLALKIRPDFQLARNNLAWAESQKKAAGK